jgi:hypothetical protein
MPSIGWEPATKSRVSVQLRNRCHSLSRPPRHHERSNEGIGLALSEFVDDATVVIHCRNRRKRGIAPAVKDDQLTASFLECSEIRIDGVEHPPGPDSPPGTKPGKIVCPLIVRNPSYSFFTVAT